MAQFYGKYRAKVMIIEDPLKMGRLKVECPKVYGDDTSGWCLPSTPFAYANGGLLMLPPKGETVWVEFEEGNPDKPIWSGCWWGQGKAPERSLVIQTPYGLIEFSQEENYIKISSGSESSNVILRDDSIVLSLGGSKIEISKNGVDINGSTVNIKGKNYMMHTHSNGNQGGNTGGIVVT